MIAGNGPDSVAHARAARLSGAGRDRIGRSPTIALAGDVDAAVLRAAGWQIKGRLPTTPYDDKRDAVGYVDLSELLADPLLDAVCLDGADPVLARLLPPLREAGLLVLLPAPAPLDTALLRMARAVPDAADIVVGLVDRFEPWALTVAAALQDAGGPLQVTVRGWPRGPAKAAELVDLARSWCGDVVAAIAAPAALPAAQLPGGEAVSWALLHESGATVLVSHEGGAPLVRLSFTTARLEARFDRVCWVGGADLPLPRTPHPSGPEPADHPIPPTMPPGLLAGAALLTTAVGGGRLQIDRWPWPADLGDLLAAARVLEALRESARSESPALVS